MNNAIGFLAAIEGKTKGFVVQTESSCLYCPTLAALHASAIQHHEECYIQGFGKLAASTESALSNYPSVSYRYWTAEEIEQLRNPPLRILILGHARHGKDTAAEYISEKYGLDFEGSSMLFAELSYDIMGYDSAKECFEDRINHRPLWSKLIAQYCHKDKARLGKEVYASNDIHCGIRQQDELEAVIDEFNPLVLWVDASKRLPLEPATSFNISKPYGAITLDNNGDDLELFGQIDTLLSMRSI